jgi:hypothetical protein
LLDALLEEKFIRVCVSWKKRRMLIREALSGCSYRMIYEYLDFSGDGGILREVRKVSLCTRSAMLASSWRWRNDKD